MKAVIVSSVGRLEVADVEAPRPGPYDALVQIEACGFCNSTDAKLIEGRMSWGPPCPFVLGHESVGTVLEVGARVRRFCRGDRVTRAMAFWPGERAPLGCANGGMAEYGIVRDAAAMAADGDSSLVDDYNAVRQCVLPKEMSALDGAIAIGLAETASVLRRLPALRGTTVVVAGTGAAGLAFAMWLKFSGARVITLGRREDRLAQALCFGADAAVNTRGESFLDEVRETAGGRIDGIIEATGDAALAGTLLPLVSDDGFACAYGMPPKGVSYGPRWQAAAVEEHLALDWVLDVVERGWVLPEWFLTHKWKLADADEAARQVARGEVLKGVFLIGPDSR